MVPALLEYLALVWLSASCSDVSYKKQGEEPFCFPSLYVLLWIFLPVKVFVLCKSRKHNLFIYPLGFSEAGAQWFLSKLFSLGSRDSNSCQWWRRVTLEPGWCQSGFRVPSSVGVGFLWRPGLTKMSIEAGNATWTWFHNRFFPHYSTP